MCEHSVIYKIGTNKQTITEWINFLFHSKKKKKKTKMQNMIS